MRPLLGYVERGDSCHGPSIAILAHLSLLSQIERFIVKKLTLVSACRAKATRGTFLTDKFVVGYSGNLGRAHEFETLLEAAGLCGSDPDIAFLMIGGGAGMTALQRAVASRGLGNFRFLPLQPRESLGDTMAAADLHWLSLLPALEGLIVPSKLYGILAAGRPVLFIGDPDGEVARVIGPARAGLSVSIGQPAELAGQIAHLKSDPILREQMGENAHRLYREKYTGQRALDRWMALLNRAEGDAERVIPESPAAGAGIPPLSDR